MFSKKNNIQALIKKAERAKKKQLKEEEQRPLTPEEQARRMFLITLGVSGCFTLIFAITNIFIISKHDPSLSSFIDTSRIDTIKTFLSTESTDKYEEIIEKHNNQDKNNKLDIKTVFSSTGREYPFANILNKTQDNMTTKLCKFIYTELKPAVISYNMANGVYPLLASEEGNSSLEIDLNLLKDLLNFRDERLSSYTYELNLNGSNSNISITVKEGNTTIPIILFDPTLFSVKEINKKEVNLIQGKYSLILKPMEEYNNIRLQSIDIDGSSKSCTIVDTITNKVVTIEVS